MAMTPDQFVERIIKEITKHQAIPQKLETHTENGLILLDPYKQRGEDDKKTGVCAYQVLDIPLSHPELIQPDTVVYGIEYPLGLRTDSFDQSTVLASAIPRGAVVYNGHIRRAEQGELATYFAAFKVQFDLRKERLAGVQLADFLLERISESFARSIRELRTLQDTPIEDGIQAAFAWIYANSNKSVSGK